MARKLPHAKEGLMQALISLMAEKPFPLIKITEICQVSGYNRGTFYKHYQQKDDLLEDLLEIKLQELNAVLEDIAKNGSRMQIVERLIPLFSYIYENRYFFSVILGEHKIAGFRLRIFEIYRQYIAQHIVKPIPSVENDPLLQTIQLDFVSSTWLGISLFWIHQQEQPTPEYVTEQFIKIMEMPKHIIFSKDWHFKFQKENTPVDAKARGARKAFQISLIKLLMMREYKLIRIQDILETSGYNRSSFYLNFADKEDLFHSLRDDLVTGMLRAFRKGPQSARAIIGRDLPISTLFDYIYENRELLKLMYSSKAVPGFFNYMFSAVSHFFAEEVSGRVDVDKDLYSNYLATTLMTIIGSWFTHGVRYSPEFISGIYLEFLHQSSV
ncbi:TetR/AcrR family transcriptional regulator C-terminal domain-containing protein [Neobacillus sp. M.A.Huq-85]